MDLVQRMQAHFSESISAKQVAQEMLPTLMADAATKIVQALVALGYSDKDAAAAIKALPADIGVSDGIRAALKSLVK